jgi:hypothetical protein
MNPNAKHNDLSKELRCILRQTTIDWRFKHVKGHTTTRPFTRPVDLNEEMDHACKAFLGDQEPVPHTQASLERERTSIWIGKRKIVSCTQTELSNFLQDQRAKLYWENKRKVEPGVIDWAAYQKARATIPRQRQVWLTKLSSSFCACGKMMLLMGKWDHDNCPRCGQSEDAEHIWTCGAPSTEPIWTEAADRLSETAAKFKTPSALTEAILEGIKWWRLGEEGAASSNTEVIQTAIDGQRKIGWRGFCEGHWDKRWQEAYKELGGKKNEVRWAAAMMRIIWDAGWKSWEQRNEEVHKKENDATQAAIDDEIRELKDANLTGLAGTETNLYQVPLETILQWVPGKRQAWLVRIQAAKKEKERKRQANPLEGMRRAMANYLRR